MDLARLGNKYLADTEPWKVIKTDPERVQTILNIALQITANLAILMEPFLPFSMEKLRTFINLFDAGWESLGNADLLKPGHQLQQPELLFEKIEDEAIEKQLGKLHGSKENEEEAQEIASQKEEIIFDDFTKMDIRTATILKAEKVPKTKKLIKMLVDTGIDKRTIVSGIAEYYDPGQLPGQRVCVLVNLAPRTIRGIESQGMILLSENSDGQLYFVEPGKDAHNGAEVN
jgi:methionyl-tRNA synthetase